MQSATAGVPNNKLIWLGRVMSFVPAAFLFFGSFVNVLLLPAAVEGTRQFGYPASATRPIGIVLLISVILYLVPRTAVFGAILLTGYFGGAVATHLHHGDPLMFLVIPVFVSALLWGGLYLREPRLRALIPLRNPEL